MAGSTESGPFEEEEDEEEGIPGLRVEVWPGNMAVTAVGAAPDFWAYKDPVQSIKKKTAFSNLLHTGILQYYTLLFQSWG